MLIRWWVNSKQNQAITGQRDVLGHSKQRSNSFLHTATENPGKTSETTQNLAQKWKTCPNPRKHPKAIQNPGKTSENHQHPGKTRKRGGKGLSPLASFTRCCLISRSCCTWRKQRSTRSTLRARSKHCLGLIPMCLYLRVLWAYFTGKSKGQHHSRVPLF